MKLGRFQKETREAIRLPMWVMGGRPDWKYRRWGWVDQIYPEREARMLEYLSTILIR